MSRNQGLEYLILYLTFVAFFAKVGKAIYPVCPKLFGYIIHIRSGLKADKSSLNNTRTRSKRTILDRQQIKTRLDLKNLKKIKAYDRLKSDFKVKVKDKGQGRSHGKKEIR